MLHQLLQNVAGNKAN